jgi:hypothetical protein
VLIGKKKLLREQGVKNVVCTLQKGKAWGEKVGNNNIEDMVPYDTLLVITIPYDKDGVRDNEKVTILSISESEKRVKKSVTFVIMVR